MAQTARADSVSSDRISSRTFKRLAAYIESETGIKMPDSKRTLVEGRLVRSLRISGAASIEDYCEYILSDQADTQEVWQLINAMTTNKTDFFREPNHFTYLRNTILPEFLREKIGTVRCWSAAASTGMEAYTMAMVIDDFTFTHGALDYDILATDIDTSVLAEAQRAVYSLESLEPVPASLRGKYVRRANDPKRKEARIVPELRQKVSFARMNLMDDDYAVGKPMDLIMCRNVLIYFEKAVQARVLSQLCRKLRRGGYLMLGHSESTMGLELPLETVSNTVFRKL
jgi:chemotaxis protein methyltransferase CheR